MNLFRHVVTGVGVGLVCSAIYGVPENELAKLLTSDGAENDWFGAALAVDGGIAVVSAHLDDDNEENSGSAYVFDLSDPANPVLASKITASDGMAGDLFGKAIALAGGIAVVTASSADSIGDNSGSAYVFDISDPANPVQVSKLIATDGAPSDFFGLSVDIDCGLAVIGATGDDDNGVDSGSAYIFDLSDPTNPSQLSKLTASDGAADAYFGSSVSIDCGLVLVGADRDDAAGDRSGSVYVFNLSDPKNPVQMSKLTAADGAAGDRFGHAVALYGNLGIVTAYYDDDHGLDSGSAYVFDLSDPAAPVQLNKITASDGVWGDFFGSSVDIQGDLALIGASGVNGGGISSGGLYAFDLTDPADPLELSKFMASDRGYQDLLGEALGIDGEYVLAGARLDNTDNGFRTGSAYVFRILDCSADANFDGVVDVNDISYVLFRLGGTAPDGDTNQDGTVDVNDISHVLFRLGDSC